ncbi:putative pentatricopeptide repeat-containing protein At5g52630 [Cryptomeria japonica]|uniref:putative pentatricopeptide repeat-containing protein At5g52630 n=1 Tax=Cryptomeria japonica TaxID=3369 RepID=UPI0025AC7F39|nr:putative pentatricopeptide repeat-containing protein At5g52630 [Cryptomeria japonica]
MGKHSRCKDEFHNLASICPACAKLGDLEQGMDIHQIIMKRGFLSDIIVGNAKYGRIVKARELFNIMPQTDIISWNSMIVGYEQNWYAKCGSIAGVKTNSRTFDSILLACAMCHMPYGELWNSNFKSAQDAVKTFDVHRIKAFDV